MVQVMGMLLLQLLKKLVITILTKSMFADMVLLRWCDSWNIQF